MPKNRNRGKFSTDDDTHPTKLYESLEYVTEAMYILCTDVTLVQANKYHNDRYAAGTLALAGSLGVVATCLQSICSYLGIEERDINAEDIRDV